MYKQYIPYLPVIALVAFALFLYFGEQYITENAEKLGPLATYRMETAVLCVAAAGLYYYYRLRTPVVKRFSLPSYSEATASDMY